MSDAHTDVETARASYPGSPDEHEVAAPVYSATYEDALAHMKRHLGRLAARFRVDVSDIRQTLYVVWSRVAQLHGRRPTESRDAFYKYLYRALENELTDTVGLHPAYRTDEPSPDTSPVSVGDAEGNSLLDLDHDAAGLALPAVDDQIRALFVRASTEAAFPEALRTHPLYAHPSCRVVLDGILDQQPVSAIAQRLGVTRRRVNAQIETLEGLFVAPDAAQVDRIFRAVPEEQWLPGAPLIRRPVDSLRYPPLRNRAGGRVLKALRRFMQLGVQPAVVYIDQFGRVLSGVDVCMAAQILGVSSVATLLQVSRSASPDLTDECYLEACDEDDAAAEPGFDLIAAFQRLYSEGYVSGIVAAFFHQLGKPAQYTILRELGTALVSQIGAREARSLLKAAREGTMQSEVRQQRRRLVARVREHAGEEHDAAG